MLESISLPQLSKSDLKSLQSVGLDIREVRTALARKSLKDFIHQAWFLVEPSTELKWNWHLDVLCSVLERVTRGEIKRLIVNIPPGCMKSLIVSVFWPAWEWANDSSRRYLTASYSDENPIRDNRRVRGIIKSDWYRSSFGVELTPDSDGKIRFDTTAKGWRIATSVGGMGTGEHPDVIIIDDPSKAKDANAKSQVALVAVNDWYDRTISTRMNRNPAVVLVMQRLHEMDLTAHLLGKDGGKARWHHVRLPMRYMARKEPTPQDPEGYEPYEGDIREFPGDLLWEEMFPEEKVVEEEIHLGPFGSSGQLQQIPIPEGGGLFEREWFEFVDQAPPNLIYCRGWDIAESDDKQKKSDWTVGVKIGRDMRTGLYYVVSAIRRKAILVDGLILSTAEMDGVRCKIREGAGSGKATIKARSMLLSAYDFEASPETDSKIERANPFRAQCQNRNVKIVRGDWNDAYLSVICSFPVGKHDDDVDASANAYNQLVQEKVSGVGYSWAKV